jgi:hypothetical protein
MSDRNGLTKGAQLETAGIGIFTLSIALSGLATAFGVDASVASAVQFLAAIAALCLTAGALLARNLDRGIEPRRWQRIAAGAVAVNWLTQVAINHTYPGSSLQWTAAHLIVITIVLGADRITLETARACLRILMIISLVGMLAGISAYSFDERTVLPFPGRLTGALGQPNVTAPAAGILLLLALAKRRFVWLDRCLAVFVLAATFSYGALIALIAGFVVLLSYKARRIGLIALSGGLALILAPYVVVSFMPTLVDPGLFTGRGAIWLWCHEMDYNHWVGLGVHFFNDYRISQHIKWFHAHNQFIMDLITGGWLAAASTIVFVLALGAAALRNRSTWRLAIWVLMVVVSTTEVPFYFDYAGSRPFLAGVLAIVVFSPEGIPAQLREVEKREDRSFVA